VWFANGRSSDVRVMLRTNTEAKSPVFIVGARADICASRTFTSGSVRRCFLFTFWNASAFSVACLAIGGSPCFLSV
jgi:hypothetical protein